MGKSLGNAIYFADDAETVTAKVRSAVTDTNRIAISDRGDPDICTVSAYHKAFNTAEYENIIGNKTVEEVKAVMQITI